ncbi:MAG: hypothetical protein ABIK81_03480 [candidate division WOR-3 bacterium]
MAPAPILKPDGADAVVFSKKMWVIGGRWQTTGDCWPIRGL